MSFWQNVFAPLTGLFAPKDATPVVEKSYGEATIAEIIGGIGSGSWGSAWGGAWGRQELANHYTGFNYLAIQPLMKEISGMTPHAAMRRDGYNVREARQKALSTGDYKELHNLKARYLSPYERSKAIAPIQTHEELEPISNSHELIRLLRNPNGPDTSCTFFRKLVMFWKLYGEFYIWLVPPKAERVTGVKHPPVEMWVLPSHWMWPHYDETRSKLFDYYEVRPYSGYYPVESSGGIGLGFYPGHGNKTLLPADQIIYYGEPNPNGFMNGYSALTAISHWIDCSDSIDRSRTAQFQNGAFPGVVVEFDKGVLEPDEPTIRRLEARISQSYVGVKRTGKSIILSPGVKMRPLDNKPHEMAYTESASQIKDWVFAAQGTGQSIVGLVEQTTFNNVWGARANFYSNTIKPMCTLLGELFTEKVGRRFDKDMVVYWPDTSPVDPDLELRKWDMLLKNNVVTPNEVCVALGLEPKEWGDKPLDMLKQEFAPGAQQGQPGQEQQKPIDEQTPTPEHPTLAQSPLHLDSPKTPDHPENKMQEASETMKNHRTGLSPSRNGKHSASLASNRLR